MAQRPEPRSRVGAIFDAVSIALFVAGWCALLGALVSAAGPLQTGWLLLLLALPGLLAADLAAGIFHWFADTFFTPSTPWIGSTVIQSFRDHHADPGAMALRSAAEVSGQNCFACLPLLAFGAVVDLEPVIGAPLVAWLLILALAIALTNLFHRWAHADHVPKRVAALQRRGWVLSAEHHSHHHRGAHDRAYCVTTDWLNPLLDGVSFFPALERAVRKIGPRAGRELAKDSRAN